MCFLPRDQISDPPAIAFVVDEENTKSEATNREYYWNRNDPQTVKCVIEIWKKYVALDLKRVASHFEK